MNWHNIPAWKIHNHDSSYFVKINRTVEETEVSKVVREGNVTLECHSTASGREIGYVLHYNQLERDGGLPRLVMANSCAYVLYRPEDFVRKAAGSIIVVYKDINVRLLKYKIGRYVDFMLVLRTTQQQQQDEDSGTT